MQMRSLKIKAGDRVTFVSAGKNFERQGLVEHVRRDGKLILHFDADPVGSILVVEPYDIVKL